MLGWIIPGSTQIGAAGMSAVGPGSVGADLGAGNAAENVRGLCNHRGWSLGMWADSPGQDLLPFNDLGL